MSIKLFAPISFEMKVYAEAPDGFAATLTLQLTSGMIPTEQEILETIGQALEEMPGHKLLNTHHFISCLVHQQTGEQGTLFKAPPGAEYDVEKLAKRAIKAWENKKKAMQREVN